MKLILPKISLIFLLLLNSNPTVLAASDYQENAHYQRVPSASIGGHEKTGKIEVIEFFLYSCPHCYEIEPKLKKWLEKNKDKVTYKQVPAVLSSNWIVLAKAYYVAERLNILDKVHPALFAAIHNDKKIYNTPYQLAEFFRQQGVSLEDFNNAYNSKAVINSVSNARELSVKYGLRGVPVVVMNDEYKTAPFYNRNQQEMLNVMDYLLEKLK